MVLIYLGLLLATKHGQVVLIYLGLLLVTGTWKSGTNLPGTVASHAVTVGVGLTLQDADLWPVLRPASFFLHHDGLCSRAGDDTAQHRLIIACYNFKLKAPKNSYLQFDHNLRKASMNRLIPKFTTLILKIIFFFSSSFKFSIRYHFTLYFTIHIPKLHNSHLWS